MEGGGGVGGGGGGGGGGAAAFVYGNLVYKPPICKPTPPLSAIDRFLWGQNHSNPRYQTQNNVKIAKQEAPSTPLFCGFPSFCGAIGGGSWFQGCPEERFVDGLFADGQSPSVSHDMNPNVGIKEMKVAAKSPKGAGKKTKKSSSAALIKGQWTDEEDRKLVKLVKQFGVRKWAQIAEKLVGRAGKQCRERWHNHLRPDIKKDSWSEEEERILIETHAKVGNRWAEIAKHIPGRTENGIKNHWNATKRRQISRRKNKQAENQNGKPQSSVLQDYIRSKYLMNNTTTTLTPSHSSTTTAGGGAAASSSSFSEDLSTQFKYFLPEPSESTMEDSPQPLFAQEYDEELLFMQNFFNNANNSIQPSLESLHAINHHPTTSLTLEYPSYNYQENSGHHQQISLSIVDSNLTTFSTSSSPEMNKIRLQAKENRLTTHLYSDIYLSYLLDGATSSPSPIIQGHPNMNMDQLADLAASSNGRREMDLIEMVSSSQFSQGSNGT